MGWEEWAARIGGYALAPFTGGASAIVGEGIAQGLRGKDAINQAQQAQQQATDDAMRRNDHALGVSGDIYNQQRADMNQLFMPGYQTLGSLMGIPVASIGPATFTDRAVYTPPPQAQAEPARHGGGVMKDEYESRKIGGPPVTADAYENRKRLGDFQQAATQQTTSSYASPRSGGPGGDVVPMIDPMGKVRMIPRARQAEAEAAGGRVLHG